MLTHPKDRRIQKTQKALRDAIASLVGEKPYDEIVVKEILDRANVGRSTFYMHFRDKDELLLSGIHDIIGTVTPPSHSGFAKGHEQILWFSLPIFEYHYLHRHVQKRQDKVGTRGRALLHEHLRKVLTSAISDVVKKDSRTGKKARQISPDLLSGYVASTFVLVLNWWVEHSMPLPPKQVNELFLALVLPTLVKVWS